MNELKPLEKSVSIAVAKATKVTIKDEKDMIEATKVLSELNRYNDEVETKKEEITKPLNLALKKARELFKPLEVRLEEGIDTIRGAMTTYQTEKVRLAKIEEDKIAARIGEGKGKLKMETAVRKMEEINKPVDKVETESGSVKFIEVQRFEVLEIDKVPRAYMVVDESKIRNAMKDSIRVPGVIYWVEQVPRNRR